MIMVTELKTFGQENRLEIENCTNLSSLISKTLSHCSTVVLRSRTMKCNYQTNNVSSGRILRRIWSRTILEK